ncbi:unnamed protein product [Amoebophrya sp. A120]|nr:unnamed protein product [Amoebophrya sp. A120]|eukprot:GSA120T00009748001.1
MPGGHLPPRAAGDPPTTQSSNANYDHAADYGAATNNWIPPHAGTNQAQQEADHDTTPTRSAATSLSQQLFALNRRLRNFFHTILRLYGILCLHVAFLVSMRTSYEFLVKMEYGAEFFFVDFLYLAM